MEQIMATSYPRDMIGYGPNPPNPQWPNGARLALNFVLNYEEGSEASFADGDGYSESTLTESGGQGVQGRDLAAESMYEYGSRVGFWRILRLFQARNLPLTIFGCALALERNPPAAQAKAPHADPRRAVELVRLRRYEWHPDLQAALSRARRFP